MFTDIVGYTALMGSDEDHAFKVLHQNREIHNYLIKKFKGKLIKEMGDGMLVSFDLAADAAQCAIEIQKRAREELKGQIRIGIHLGDITFEHEDVFGDGVNIASRLQSITDPGGIYLSESLQKSIRGKIDIQTKYLGEFKLKNVDYPVRTYAVQGDGLPIPTSTKIKSLKNKSAKKRIFRSVSLYIVLLFLLLAGGWLIRNEFFVDQSTITSLVVLPFDNFTGDDELEYFVAGMHSSLISDIGKISALRVISKTTSNAYKDADKSMPEIASELGVNAVIEGSVLCLGDTICFQVKVVSAYPEEQQLWVQEYRVEKSQILNLYNTVTKEISNEINVILTPEEERLLARSRTVDGEAYDEFMKAHSYWEDFSKESLDKALDYLNSAIEKEPDWAPLYAGLANTWIGIQQMGYEPPSVSSPKIYENLNKAIELDPDLSDSHYLSGLIAHVMEWDWEKSEREFLKALAINPNDAQSRSLYAQLLCVLQRTGEGITQGRLALDLDPLNPYIKVWYGAILPCVGDYKTALELAETITATDPGHYLANNIIQFAAFYCQEYDKSIKAERYLLPAFGVKEDDIKEIERIFNEQGIVKAYEKIMIHLEDFASNNPISPLDMAVRYMFVNQPDKAMDWLEKGFELHNPAMTYIATKMCNFAPLFNNPRFIDIVKKMNLPLP
jgi:adenylate cyclase